MEYVFGAQNEAEILRTKGSTHTDLTGYQEIFREFHGEKITDNFRVVRKLKVGEDADRNCYDWYEIDRHYRTIDKSGPILKEQEQLRADVDFLLIMEGLT